MTESGGDPLVGLAWLFVIIFGFGLIVCLFWGVGYYGNYVHVHRSYFERRDGKGKLMEYGYRTLVDDTNATHGHTGYYTRAYAKATTRTRS